MKKIFLLIAVGIILIAIPATVFLVGQQQELRKRAAPATTLSFSPSTVTKSKGETFKLNIEIDPASNQVTTAKLFITYDPLKLEATAITNGPLAPSVLNSGLIASASASITVGAASTAQPITQKGTIAVITFKALDGTGATPTTVSFASTTFIGGLGETTANVLSGSTPAKITITGTIVNQSAQSTSTSTTTPTVTTTPTLTLTPTLAATTSGQATASAVTITTPASGANITDDTPTITGKAQAGATVTITIYSAVQTVVVTADANGNWSYTPITPLEPGPHSIVASAQTAGGTTQTATTTFVVTASSSAGATESAVPISGNTQTTLLFIILGCISLLLGFGFSLKTR